MIKKCLPQSIATHYQFEKFQSIFPRYPQNKKKLSLIAQKLNITGDILIKSHSSWTSIVEKCFSHFPEKEEKIDDSNKKSSASETIIGNFTMTSMSSVLIW